LFCLLCLFLFLFLLFCRHGSGSLMSIPASDSSFPGSSQSYT
jgi:hypothetical protein